MGKQVAAYVGSMSANYRVTLYYKTPRGRPGVWQGTTIASSVAEAVERLVVEATSSRQDCCRRIAELVCYNAEISR